MENLYFIITIVVLVIIIIIILCNNKKERYNWPGYCPGYNARDCVHDIGARIAGCQWDDDNGGYCH